MSTRENIRLIARASLPESKNRCKEAGDKNSTRPLVVKSRKDEQFFPRTSAFERITRGSCITYYSLKFFIAYAFHVFAG